MTQRKRPSRCVVYVHVPKAAGNSSIAALWKHFSDPASVDWRNPNQSILDILRDWNVNQNNFISGHINYSHLKQLEALPCRVEPITFFRDPIDRIVSNYRYTTGSTSPDSVENRKRWPDFATFVDKVSPNEIAAQVVGKVADFEDYSNRLKKYAFIGIAEFLRDEHRRLAGFLNIPFEEVQTLNVTPADAPRPDDLLTPALEARLRQTQALDIEMYEHLCRQRAPT